MRDDEYRQTAKALARETRMSDASAARIEQKLLNAVADREGRESRPAGWFPFGHSVWVPLAAAAALVLIVGSISLWNMSRVTVDTTSERAASDKPSTLADIVLPLPPKPAVMPSETGRGNRPAHSAQTARVVRPNGFVELPWTAGLPAFESGEIVRVEVPVASLPAYGFDISRGTNRSVEADVLVGQDGLARAMRLVTNSARSTQ